jgi:tripartite-type tricarboxylate transporter receptor subunit TctC
VSAGCKVAAGMLFAAVVAAAPAALAEADYPNRPVTLIVPYAAGGVADVGMRILGEQLSNRLKQQFVVENRPGAAGIVAAQTGAAAAPDGYTLLMTGNNTAIAVALFKSLPYNILTDFDSVSTAAFFDVLIVTRAASPLKSVADLVAAAKANPGKLNIGTINPGSTQNLAGIKDYDVASWNGLSVPAGTPKPVIATLNAAMKAVIPGPDVQSKASQMGMAMRWSTPEDMTARMKADIAKWGAVIEKAGIPKRE